MTRLRFPRLATIFGATCLLFPLLVRIVAAAPPAKPDSASSSTDSARSSEATAPDAADAEETRPIRIRRRTRAPTTDAPESAVDALESRIDGILENRVSSEARIGIYAVDVQTGQVLYDRRGEETFNPASNMKLLTSAAALHRFGPSHTFETELLASNRSSGRIEGGLYLRGDGDAFLLFEDVVGWAGQLRAKGIDRIEGGIIIDDTLFEEDYLPPAYGQKDEDASYRAPIGAVSVNFNSVTAIAEPGPQAGAKPSIRTFPPNDHVQVDNRAKTVAGAGRSLIFKSEPTDDGATVLIVEGSIGVDAAEMRSRLRIDNPPAYAGSILREALQMTDIEVEGPVRTGKTPVDAEPLISHDSQPLSYIVLAMNKWSNNFMAEQLLRRLGAKDDRSSTWSRARQSMRSFVKTVGIPPGDIDIENGSGLYHGNAVAPRDFVRLLTWMLDHRAGPEFVSSLAVAGIDGTLKNRMEDPPLRGNLRGKTGTLNHVSALSGYLHTESERLIAFSMLFNETPRRGWRYRSVQDAIARALAEFRH